MSWPRSDRRHFMKSVSSAGATACWDRQSAVPEAPAAGQKPTGSPGEAEGESRLDFSPARWIWYPSQRCLQNTFILFRRKVEIGRPLRRAQGWILADSRYLLTVNGQRIQWGPAPADPRWPEADPLDLAPFLKQGENVIGCQVLFYGQGDGTWPMGKPGFLFRLPLEFEDGSIRLLLSDPQWQAHLARSWKPGHYKRWFLRSLQEDFDARHYPYGWDQPGFAAGPDWLPAMALEGPADKPSVCTSFPEYMLEIRGQAELCSLQPRQIPLLKETEVPVKGLVESFWIDWRRPAEEYFECLPPDSFRAVRAEVAQETAPGQWVLELPEKRGAALTFEFQEQLVGWPFFQIEAPEGTQIEMLVHEAHQPGGPVLINSHFHSWTRFRCRAGKNRFETFDFESLRWLQLHVHGATGRIRIWGIGLRRRVYPWPRTATVRLSDPALQRLMDATLLTLDNCAQDILVDGMARERQQYSGDCGHQLHAIFYAYGEQRQPARYLRTFSQGMTVDGYFLDCWPAYDRMARLMERQLQLTGWGPILDHGVGFNFDCYYYYLYSGDRQALREPFPRLVRFLRYLQSIQGKDRLLPVENIGIPSVWIDHVAYRRPGHKQCAFNLYAAAMLEHALAPLCRALGEDRLAATAAGFGSQLRQACIEKFWSPQDQLWVVNLPWMEAEKERRTCDRSLATGVLFDQFPGQRTQAALAMLADCPPEMGLSYPANAGWRLWALCKGGRADVVLKDLRTRWATMPSVLQNKTLQEDWTARPDSGSQWSHCPVAPIYILFMGIAGILPREPGFRRCRIRPQLADLESLELIAWTAQGPLHFRAEGRAGKRTLVLNLPAGCEGELALPPGEEPGLEPIAALSTPDFSVYRLPAGKESRVLLRRS